MDQAQTQTKPAHADDAKQQPQPTPVIPQLTVKTSTKAGRISSNHNSIRI